MELPRRTVNRRKLGWPTMAVLTTVVALLALWFQAGWGGHDVIRWADDLSCEAASAVAAWAAFRAGKRRSSLRTWWLLIGLGSAFWAAGQLVWCIYDLLLGVVLSVPSLADAGYLMYPVVAVAALSRLPMDRRTDSGFRWVLDGGIVGLSGLLLAWSWIIVPTGHSSGRWTTTFVELAYPATDVVLLTATVLAALHCALGRRHLLVVAGGMSFLAVADAWYSYLSVSNQYQAGDLCDVMYVAAFLVMATAAFTARQGDSRQQAHLPETLRVMLPYIPFSAAVAVVVGKVLAGQHLGKVEVLLGGAVTVLLVFRQGLALALNGRLLQEVERQKEQLGTLAMTDALTGLANRPLFLDRIEHATASHARCPRDVSLCWIDLDDFKLVNDGYGHTAGDELLVKVAERLRGAVRAGDTLARLGGDEFALLVEDDGDVVAGAERLRFSLRQPFYVAGQSLAVTASIGVAVLRSSEHNVSAQELIGRADIAMYHAKIEGKDRVVLHDCGMSLPGADGPILREALRRAIDDGEIKVVYQPIYWADDGSLRGFEALARWTLAGEQVSPARFISLAEKLGYGTELGDQVLDVAVAQIAHWTDEGAGFRPMVGVNLSPSQVLDPGLPQRVRAVLARHRVPPDQLILEITESALLTDSQVAIDVTRALADLGVELSLDDFGIGFSSLAHLRGLPLESIKVDRTFVTSVESDLDARQFIAAVIRLGHDLGLRVVTEGVETVEQLEIIRELGCDLVQGFLLSRPQSAEQFDGPTTHSAVIQHLQDAELQISTLAEWMGPDRTAVS
jgi:diguanylate cyclase (GGDEF)-like protein